MNKNESYEDAMKNRLYLQQRAKAISIKDIDITISIANSSHPYKAMVNYGDTNSYGNIAEIEAYLTGVNEVINLFTNRRD